MTNKDLYIVGYDHYESELFLVYKEFVDKVYEKYKVSTEDAFESEGELLAYKAGLWDAIRYITEKEQKL